jgi:hypothetical protein
MNKEYEKLLLKNRQGMFVGEIVRGKDIGRLRQEKFIWAECESCGGKRWTREYMGEPRSKLCLRCGCRKGGLSQQGRYHSHWKGGRYQAPRGYIYVRLFGDDLFYIDMVNGFGYILEHRLIMAKSLNRCLQSWEHVHHKNGIRDDNRIENLELTTKSGHMVDHNRGYKDGYIKGLVDGKDKRIATLEQRVTLGIRLQRSYGWEYLITLN